MAKGIYAGVKTEVATTKTVVITGNNINEYFDVTPGTYTFKDSDGTGVFSATNLGVSSSTASIIAHPKQVIRSWSFDYSYVTEKDCDKFSAYVRYGAGGSLTLITEKSGTSSGTKSSSTAVPTTDYFYILYKKDSSSSASGEKCQFSNFTITIDATETKSLARKVEGVYRGVAGVAHKVTSGYRGVSGVARQFHESIKPLEACTWAEISAIAASGQAPNYWSVGDTKSIKINGKVGNSADFEMNGTFLVYIIGFNHDGASNTIDFGTFKTVDGRDFALSGTSYGVSTSKGSVRSNMQFGDDEYYGDDKNASYDGWRGCDLRYGFLGSTDVRPDGYFTALKQTSHVGYDATPTCATNPPYRDSLMGLLPSDLRAVMKPMTVYTGGRTAASYPVTSTIDYLPLLAEFEVFGVRSKAKSNEYQYQSQYEYYANGNSKLKFPFYSNSIRTSSYTGGTFNWWLRSQSDTKAFCRVSYDGIIGSSACSVWHGVAPIFRV